MEPKILKAQVFHERTLPKLNRFKYRLFYLAMPLASIDSLSVRPFFSIDAFGLLSVVKKDHGDRTGKDLSRWANDLLAQNGIDGFSGEIILVAMPRLLGYGFNPVSFWLCYENDGSVRAVIAEVNNTFGETHSYVCARDDGKELSKEDRFYASKEFHVSPFLDRSGYYEFRFRAGKDSLAIHIDYYDAGEQLQLRTILSGNYSYWNTRNLVAAWVSCPLITVKAIAMIHWQAVKLLFKSAKYRSKPQQHRWWQTRARNVKELLYSNADGQRSIEIIKEC